MLKTELKVEAVGKPNISCLTDGEQRLFFETILSVNPGGLSPVAYREWARSNAPTVA